MNSENYTRRDFLKTIGVGAAAIAMPVRLSVGGTPASKPNIILILTDDQGWTHTSVQMMAGRPDSRSDFYQTPNLERLAREGMRFSNGYTPAPVCVPTRGSIQFGKTPARLKNTCHNKSASSCVGEISIAQMIKAADANYATAHFGKWGLSKTPTPLEELGYDQSDGRTGNGDGYCDDPDNPKRTFGVTERANGFMAEQVGLGRPFYMQVSYYAVHVAHDALESTIEKYQNLVSGDPDLVLYAAMIEDLDTGVGMIFDKVDQLGIADNTYIIFTSDNGGGFRGNKPLRGGKANLWEGGIREPMVVRGPGIQAGAICDEPVVGWDFFPTVSDLIGNQNPLPDGIDGGSLRPLFESTTSQPLFSSKVASANLTRLGKVKRPREELIFHYPWWLCAQSAIRQGDYKLLKDWFTGEIFLFNLADDIGENNNLASSMREKAKSLEKKLMDYLEAVDAEKAEDIYKEMTS